MLELNSIPAGIEAGDAMMKAADVRLIEAHSVCAGKYIVLVSGEVAAVNASVKAGREIGKETVVDELMIPNVHPGVIRAMTGCCEIERFEALGIVETFSLAAAILAADAAVKAASIELIEIRLGMGLGGKSFVLMTGSVADVRFSVETAAAQNGTTGMLAGTAVIPSPHPDIINAIL